MPQESRALRLQALLAHPAIFRLFNRMAASRSQYRGLVRSIGARPGDRVLDLGCGLGDVSAALPDVDYTGIDISQEYIDAARHRYGNRARFICGRFDEVPVADDTYDLVMAIGVVHHLNDQEALKLHRTARRVLKPGGRLFLYDPCYAPEQSRLARWIISHDRGDNVRTVDGYQALVSQAFGNLTRHVRHDLLRFPYTVVIFDCVKH